MRDPPFIAAPVLGTQLAQPQTHARPSFIAAPVLSTQLAWPQTHARPSFIAAPVLSTQLARQQTHGPARTAGCRTPQCRSRCCPPPGAGPRPVGRPAEPARAPSMTPPHSQTSRCQRCRGWSWCACTSKHAAHALVKQHLLPPRSMCAQGPRGWSAEGCVCILGVGSR